MRNAKTLNESLIAGDGGFDNDLGYSSQICCCVRHFDSRDMIKLRKRQHFNSSVVVKTTFFSILSEQELGSSLALFTSVIVSYAMRVTLLCISAIRAYTFKLNYIIHSQLYLHPWITKIV